MLQQCRTSSQLQDWKTCACRALAGSRQENRQSDKMTNVPHPDPDHREDGNADSAFPFDLGAASARPSCNKPATQNADAREEEASSRANTARNE